MPGGRKLNAATAVQTKTRRGFALASVNQKAKPGCMAVAGWL